MVDRQMLPRQTKRTLGFSDMIKNVVGSLQMKGQVVVDTFASRSDEENGRRTKLRKNAPPNDSQALANLNDVRVQGQLQSIR